MPLNEFLPFDQPTEHVSLFDEIKVEQIQPEPTPTPIPTLQVKEKPIKITINPNATVKKQQKVSKKTKPQKKFNLNFDVVHYGNSFTTEKKKTKKETTEEQEVVFNCKFIFKFFFFLTL